MNGFYRTAYCLAFPVVRLLYPAGFEGRENVPDGACVVCANHSSLADPVLVTYACGLRHVIHYMGKAELFKNRLFAAVLRWLGAFPVQRGKPDLAAVKTAMQYLKKGEKLGIFPEGTRVSLDDAVAAKTGAVSLAARMHVPILPVYIPRERKKFNRRLVVRIGKPYCVDGARHEDFSRLSAELMERIQRLGQER